MEKVNAELVKVSIRRNAYTTTYSDVFRHELPVVMVIHGKDNVQAEGVMDVREVQPDSEYGRLCQKYGFDNVIKVYGQDEGLALVKDLRANHEAILKAQAEAAAKAEGGAEAAQTEPMQDDGAKPKRKTAKAEAAQE